MIPILYENTETVFTTNGLGRLAETIECTVKRERNGIYECEFVYPMNGQKFSEIKEGRIIAVTHDESGKTEPFDIYGHSAPIDGKVTFYAHHISYRLGNVTVKPFTASSCADALAKMKTNSINTNEFDFWTDKAATGAYSSTYPRILKGMLGGEEGSILDVYGAGEYDYSRFDVKLYTRMGTDTDVTIRYGKNLADLTEEIDFSDSYNGIVPFWSGQDEDGNDITVMLPEWVIYKSGTTWDGRNAIIPYDFSGDFEEEPTESELRSAATNYINNNDPRLPVNTLNVDFVQLWQTEEYKDFAPLEKVGLCDTVRVIFTALGIDTRLKVVETDWNVLLDRYNSLTLGDAPQTYAEVITDRIGKETALNTTLIRWVQGWATNALKIANDTNQYFWFTGTGTDTGAHITEKPREEFITDPTNGGGNLLARSNGIAIRDGLTELATFGSNGALIGMGANCQAEIVPNGMALKDYGGAEYFKASDLRAYGPSISRPYATITDRYTGDGSNTLFGLSLQAYDTNYAVQVNGVTVTPSEKYTRYFTLATAPASGATITATYITTSSEAKTYTLGTRGSGGTGPMSATIGRNNVAERLGAVAIGNGNTAYAKDSIVIGTEAEASGEEGISIGHGTKASWYNATAMGEYNVPFIGEPGVSRSDEYAALIFGNGTADNARSNALRLDWGGDLHIKGKLYVGSNANSSGGTEYGAASQYTGNVVESITSTTSLQYAGNLCEVEKGLWIICASVRFTASATGTRACQLAINGTNYAASYVASSGLSNGVEALETTLVVRLSGNNNSVDIYARQNSGSDMNVTTYYRAIKLS